MNHEQHRKWINQIIDGIRGAHEASPARSFDGSQVGILLSEIARLKKTIQGLRRTIYELRVERDRLQTDRSLMTFNQNTDHNAGEPL